MSIFNRVWTPQQLHAMIGRIDLLDIFNFLVLPETIEKLVKKNGQIKRKTRYYISEQLKYMVQDNTGVENGSASLNDHVLKFEGQNNRPLPCKIENANIPVRL